MKYVWAMVLNGLLILALGSGPVLTIVSLKKPALVFRDEFNGEALDKSNWVTCYDWSASHDKGCTNGGNFEQEWYMPSQVSVADGMVTLTAERNPITATENGKTAAYEYRSGMISTGRPQPSANARWSLLYGYYEAKMRFDGGKGVWPAFWLLPIDKSWPPEIDIMENLGDRPNEILQTVHWQDGDKRQKDTSIIRGPDYTGGWHTYAVNWQPGKIEWFIDGDLKKTVTGNKVPSKPMEIILNLAIGGMLPGNADSTTPFPRRLSIDYVRVYSEKP